MLEKHSAPAVLPILPPIAMHSAVSLMVFGLLLSLQLHILPCHAATDTVSPGQELAGGDKLVSSNGRFALGFFQAESRSSDDTPKWYLGIWFNTVPKFTPVWVANGENPVANLPSCKLLVYRDGNLLIQAKESTVWSSKANTTTKSTIATLLNNGNLVLRSASNASNIFWQSFDHPTDTILQGAKIGWNNATGLIRRLVSKRNDIDQAPGLYSFELFGHNGATSIISSFNSSKPYWSSGDWAGRYFSNIPETVGQTWLSLNFTSNEQEKYIDYAIEDPTVLSRGIMDVSGQLKVLLWFEGSRDWQTIFTAPKSQCDVYAFCGPFTVCNDVTFPSCTCMKGFSIGSLQDWELDDRTGGCARNTPLYCDGNSSAAGMADKFYPMPSVQVPADAQNVGTATSADECALVCLRSCSCTAYSYGEGGCSVWHDKLLNVRQQGNSVLHLRLAAKEVQSSKSHRRGVIIGAAIGASTATLGLIFLLMIWMRKGKRYGDDIQGGMGIIAFRYVDLQCATKKFSEKLGAGSFGSVFKGSLSDSTTVAVKRLDGARQGEKQFRAEVSSIGIIQHVNLVKLIGFCCEGDVRLLVYEHMPNGSLDAHLFQSNGTVLDWTLRYQIALGVARGLAYLHVSCRDCIIHCDIKPENILLDGSFIPKVADFGMAKFLGRDFSHVVTTMRGTVGYLAPEWISGTAITSKVDVYSYGMVLLEIISGSRNSSKQSSSDGVYEAYFPVRVARSLLDGDIASLVDANLLGEANLEEVERVCKLACWCIQDDEFDRPTMSEVVQYLEGMFEVETPPMPRLLQTIAGGPNLKIT
ncbi:G-type lectin S-receptor-like serine/threonine-protein kinase At2g19130 [Phragmites australis]|uniref:G-type lectin S-receptor-like serine/threonine-protein kinase At2g19130 n=1 Tax=Phragmites australis TaxID=29695 RepID=UPI002D78D6A0|nr:G-type lectin S-receptor-like serine/threonine-protein kinase At2g19130 [Phragmites australis]